MPLGMSSHPIPSHLKFFIPQHSHGLHLSLREKEFPHTYLVFDLPFNLGSTCPELTVPVQISCCVLRSLWIRLYTHLIHTHLIKCVYAHLLKIIICTFNKSIFKRFLCITDEHVNMIVLKAQPCSDSLDIHLY